MLKVLWFSSYIFCDKPIKGTASWIRPMGIGLARSGQVDLHNISFSSSLSLKRENYQGIIQYYLPRLARRERWFGIERSHRFMNMLRELVDEINPDIVHFWGTESDFIALYERGYIKCPAFVDIQGVMSTIAPAMSRCLSFTERIKVNFGFRELRHIPELFFLKERHYRKQGEKEIKRLSRFPVVSVQSDWVEAQLKGRIPGIKTVRTGIILRDEFYRAPKWASHNHKSPVLFSCASSVTISYKGLYVLLKALVVLKQKYPEIRLKLAGNKPRTGIMKTGFERIVSSYIDKYNLNQNIDFLGPLEASELIDALLASDLCVIPSFVETYSLALAEAQIIGTPCVVSYVGAMPEVAVPGETALYYDPTDYYMLAYQIDRCFKNNEVSSCLSTAGIKRREKENDVLSLLDNQICIYKRIGIKERHVPFNQHNQ